MRTVRDVVFALVTFPVWLPIMLLFYFVIEVMGKGEFVLDEQVANFDESDIDESDIDNVDED